MSLGRLENLLNVGNKKQKIKIDTEFGLFEFTYKVLLPKEDEEVDQVVSNDKPISRAIETLSRSLHEINETPLEDFPNAVGSSKLEKKKWVLEQLNRVILQDLWEEYNNAVKGLLNAEDEQIKK